MSFVKICVAKFVFDIVPYFDNNDRKTALSNCQCSENGPSDRNILFRGVTVFVSALSVFISDSGDISYERCSDNAVRNSEASWLRLVRTFVPGRSQVRALRRVP